jgi:[amino group carrier protein]-lysine/ornithine hydrolase
MESIALLTGLLQHFSPTHSEDSAVSFLVDAMHQMGFESHVDKVGNAVGTIGRGPQELLLLGHIDTVAGEIAIRQENGVLFGRGAVDAKGPLASFVCAAASVELLQNWRITVIGAVGEEGDSRGARYLCETYPAPAAVVIGEPSGWNSITLGYKGNFWVELTFNQAASHTASGRTSACDQAVRYWNNVIESISQFNVDRDRVFDQITPSLRGFLSKSDGFEDQAVLKANFRLPQEIDQESIQNILNDASGKTDTHPDILVKDYMPAYLSGKNNLLVKAFLSGIRQVEGTPGFKLKSGSADMNLVGPVWNCPVVAYGPGDSTLDHTADEHIRIDEYLKGIQVLKNVLEKIQNAPNV